MKLAYLIGLLVLVGCTAPDVNFYAKYQLMEAEAALTHERAEIVKAYRLCLAANPDPQLGKKNCEHYTQMLIAIDVRGVK